MRQIGTISNEGQARLFSQCLYAKGIHNAVEGDEPGKWSVWVHEEDRLTEAAGLLEQFQVNPTAAEWKEQTKKAALLREEERRSQKQFEKRFRKADEILPRSRAIGVGLLTLIFIGVCGYLAVITNLGKNDALVRQMMIADPLNFAGTLREVWQGEVWRLFTPIFMHNGLMHLVFNMMALFFLGSLVEDRKGSLYFLFLVLITSLSSNLLQYHIGGPRFVGMSGVIYGLFGFAWMRGKFDPASNLALSHESVIFIMAWFVLCWVGAIKGIANYAHTGGLLIGMAWGFLSAKLRR